MFETIIGLIVGGAGRLGMSILRFLFDFIAKKQELKELELKQQNNNTCQNVCKFDISAIEDLQPTKFAEALEKEQPKRFNFIIVIFALAVLGMITSVYLGYKFNDLNVTQKNLETIFVNCWVIIGYTASWVFTDKLSVMFSNCFKK